MKGVNSVQVGIEDAASSGNLGTIYTVIHISFLNVRPLSAFSLCVSFLMYHQSKVLHDKCAKIMHTFFATDEQETCSLLIITVDS